MPTCQSPNRAERGWGQTCYVTGRVKILSKPHIMPSVATGIAAPQGSAVTACYTFPHDRPTIHPARVDDLRAPAQLDRGRRLLRARIGPRRAALRPPFIRCGPASGQHRRQGSTVRISQEIHPAFPLRLVRACHAGAGCAAKRGLGAHRGQRRTAGKHPRLFLLVFRSPRAAPVVLRRLIRRRTHHASLRPV